jgi:NADH-quinone oxidoreductase subunit E
MNADPASLRLLSDRAYQRIDREIAKYPHGQQQSATMAALHIAQQEIGWCSPEVIEDVARVLGMAPIAVHEVASFYNMYDMQPVGRFKVSVCTNLPCQLRDGAKAGEYLKQRLGIGYDQTTADGRVTLKESECLGACADAPVLLVNNTRMCSFMSNEKLDALVAEIKAAR